MDAQTCLKKLGYVGVLAFATVDGGGAPQVRNISAIHYESDGLYFYTARGKDFCRELLADGRVQVLGYTMHKEMIRLWGRAVPVPEEEQEHWRDLIFAEQPYLSNVYPGDTRSIGIVFQLRDFAVEYFNLGVRPIFRESYVVGGGELRPKGYLISDRCIGCGACQSVCPQRAIDSGSPFRIRQENCLHCGSCFEHCPVSAICRQEGGG
ncbi:MAG TPA: 4Fe-4S binding protein [Candidatus Galloscillospira excrementavium]|nr:4Fe-4S binding protein [Candidatus Galloscillospira excrementavium]